MIHDRSKLFANTILNLKYINSKNTAIREETISITQLTQRDEWESETGPDETLSSIEIIDKRKNSVIFEPLKQIKHPLNPSEIKNLRFRNTLTQTEQTSLFFKHLGVIPDKDLHKYVRINYDGFCNNETYGRGLIIPVLSNITPAETRVIADALYDSLPQLFECGYFPSNLQKDLPQIETKNSVVRSIQALLKKITNKGYFCESEEPSASCSVKSPIPNSLRAEFEKVKKDFVKEFKPSPAIVSTCIAESTISPKIRIDLQNKMPQD